jgi:hypothetical protein
MIKTPRHPGTNGRIGITEFISLTQAEVDAIVATCDGTECPLYHPGCRPGECPKENP